MAEGFRLLPNGERLDLEISVVPAFGNWPDIGQLVVEDWADVGVRAHIEIRERTPHFAMRDSGDLQIEIWNEDTTGFPFSGQPKFDVRSNPSLTLAPLSQQWINTKGAQGVPPAPELQHLMDIIDEAKVVRPRAPDRARPRAVPDLDRQRLGDRHGRPHADGAGRDRRQQRSCATCPRWPATTGPCARLATPDRSSISSRSRSGRRQPGGLPWAAVACSGRRRARPGLMPGVEGA